MIRLFKVSVPGSILALIASETVLLFCCYVLAVSLTVEAPDVYLMDENGLWTVTFVVLSVLIGMYLADFYEDYRFRSRLELVQRLCMVLGSTFLLQALFNYSRSGILVLPKWSMLYGSAFTMVSVTAWRMFFSGAVSKAMGGRKLLFLGSSEAVAEMIHAIRQKPELGLRPLGFLDGSPDAVDKLSGSPRLGSIGDLDRVVTELRPDSIIVGLTDRRGRLPLDRLLDLRLSGIHVEDAAFTYQNIFHRVSTRDLRPSELIFSAELGPNRQKMALQSVYSLLIAVVGIVVTLPLMAVLAILVKITSRGPVLFRQTRVGFKGQLFAVYKFRSMRQNAEMKTGPIWATKDDPRVTPLGRWLRKLRLDELPQLFNVLRGEMSVVGPRPERPEFVTVLEEKIPYYRLRHCVKPGITGWAQINYRYSDTIEDSIIKLEYDLYYIKNLAWSLDAYIMFHTAKTMIFGRGAQ